jgi:hypothetical protein
MAMTESIGIAFESIDLDAPARPIYMGTLPSIHDGLVREVFVWPGSTVGGPEVPEACVVLHGPEFPGGPYHIAMLAGGDVPRIEKANGRSCPHATDHHASIIARIMERLAHHAPKA